MEGALFELIRFHRIAYAHALKTDAPYHFALTTCGFGNYGLSTPEGGVMEIGVVEKNPLCIVELRSKTEFTVREGDVFLLLPGRDYRVESVEEGVHQHTSAEFLLDCRVGGELPAEREADGKTLFLPYRIPNARGTDGVVARLRKIARDRMLLTQRSFYSECADFMALMAEIDRVLSRTGGEKRRSPSQLRYCRKVKEYISEHYREPLTLQQLADHVGINKNYLTNLFSACEQMPVSEYINRVRLGQMIDLIMKYGYSIRKAGAAVGFSDENYVSRIFHRYYGVTFSEYRRMNDRR